MTTMPAKLEKQTKRYWDLETAAADNGAVSGELYLYGSIVEAADWWFGSDDDVTPKGMLEALQALGDISELNVHIFSNGGDVFAGNAIYALLKQRKETVNIYIEGIAASIASVIAMAGDKVYIAKTAMFMIHNPMLFLFGMFNKIDMHKYVAELDRVRDVITIAYTDKTGMEAERINAMLDANDGDGTYLNATEAVALGFADAVTPDAKAPLDMVAMVRPNVYMARGREIDLSVYNNAPQLAVSGYRAQKGKVKMPRGKAVNKHGKFKAELATLECPHCRTVLDFDSASGIVTLKPEEDATVAVPMEARRIGKNFQNELYKITCPECQGEFEFETDPDTASQVTPVEGPGAGANIPLPTQAKRRGNIKAARKISRARMQDEGIQLPPEPKEAETVPVDITCTECGYAFCIDVDPAISEAVTNCPNCQAELTVDTSSGGNDGTEELPPADNVVAAYRRGIIAERRRQKVLDERTRSFP